MIKMDISNKAMSVSLAVLIAGTLFLVIFSITTFYLKGNSMKDNFNSAGFLESVYAREAVINFYIDNAVENAAYNAQQLANPKYFKIIFRDQLRQEIEKYRENGKFIVPEFEQIESQIGDENVDYNSGKIAVTFQIRITGSADDNKGLKIFSATRIYTKRFEKAA